MKKLLCLLLLLLFVPQLSACNNGKMKIAIVKLGTHLSLDEINTAIINKLNEQNGEDKNYEIEEYNANFNMDTASQIMKSIKNDASLVIAIATPIAQAAYNSLNEDTPIIFAAVSDPVAAGLVKDINNPSENITGTSDAIQIDLILDKALEIDPELKTLGFIYNPNEDNSVSNLAKIQNYCTKNNITLNARGIMNASEMSEVANVLATKVDAMFVTDDNTVASSMQALSDICIQNNIPCYAGADSLVKDGGMLGIGINYTNLGIKTAEFALDVLDGKKISELPIYVFDTNLDTYVNMEYLSLTTITIPSNILDTAIKVNNEE